MTGAPGGTPRPRPLTPLLDRYDHVLLDLDGCVYVGRALTPGAREAIEALRAAGKGIAFLTNDPYPSTEDVVQRLWRLGIRTSLREVVTVGGAVQHVLATTDRYRHAVVIGSPALHRHVHDAGCRIVNGRDLPAPDVVVVGGHPDFHYDELKLATQALLAHPQADLLTAGRDAVFPMPDGPWPGTGALTAALETATGRRARNVGKPDAQIFATALDRLEGATPQSTLMVGDNVHSDLQGAHDAGIGAAIVLTGATTAQQAAQAADPKPVAVAATLGTLVLAGSAP